LTVDIIVISHVVIYAVILGGDSLKLKLDSISDTVTDNVRETGTTRRDW